MLVDCHGIFETRDGTQNNKLFIVHKKLEEKNESYLPRDIKLDKISKFGLIRCKKRAEDESVKDSLKQQNEDI